MHVLGPNNFLGRGAGPKQVVITAANIPEYYSNMRVFKYRQIIILTRKTIKTSVFFWLFYSTEIFLSHKIGLSCQIQTAMISAEEQAFMEIYVRQIASEWVVKCAD